MSLEGGQNESSSETGFSALPKEMKQTPKWLMQWLGDTMKGGNWFDFMAPYSGKMTTQWGDNYFKNFAPNFRGAGDMLANTLGGQYLNPESNKYLGRYVESAIRPLTDSWNETILPGIKTEAQKMGAMTSDAYGRTVGRAGRDLANTIGDVSAKMWAPAYESERDRMMGAAGMASDLSGAELSQMQSARGIQQQELDRYYQEFLRRITSGENMMNTVLGLLSAALSGSPISSSSGWNAGIALPVPGAGTVPTGGGKGG